MQRIQFIYSQVEYSVPLKCHGQTLVVVRSAVTPLPIMTRPAAKIVILMHDVVRLVNVHAWIEISHRLVSTPSSLLVSICAIKRDICKNSWVEQTVDRARPVLLEGFLFVIFGVKWFPDSDNLYFIYSLTVNVSQ